MLLPCVLLLSACTADRPAPTASAPAGQAESTYTAPPATETAPLRGTSVPTGSLAHPSLAAKIDDHEAARPQFGLERTDLVFEELVEGGLTRYVAVWHSDIPDVVGPIRSIRPMDPDIIAPLGGIVAYSGGQQQFIDMMTATSVVNAAFDSDETGLFSRTDKREAPHNVVLQAKALVERNDTVSAPPRQFAYAATVPESSAAVDGTPVTTISSRFSDSRWPDWTWDAASTSYLRKQEGAPDLDAGGAQLRSTNVIALRVAIDDTYLNVPKTTMIGSGEAWVSTGGKTLHALWTKAAQAAPIRLTDDNGVVIRLAPGNTWIELVPVDRGSVALVP
ncbi:hypothetical protein RCH16_000375 [Cryobacterium sp. MP_M5]|uniref:DUF3048 domain-containing protein n=1 Tax=unclassified Cryobacterium TaxID=2649013 RepID=UPI0018CB37D6|nr:MULTISPECIES: DUF3048 domain-containing protein [unclassified Cryobacterium]MBG6057189.1 hypothetical protein [Cryobacterium sp. MP_M3]MEC5175388.1 hypothetical protein [Cryobacterium sp. MP_M5]